MTQSKKPVALITGGSSGIGLELAKQFAQNGYNLILVARDQVKLDDASSHIKSIANNIDIKTINVDLSRENGGQDAYDRVQETGWTVDVLCNNAGCGVYGDFATETSLKDEIKMIHLNVVTVTTLAKLFVKDMVTRGSGKILFTASVASLSGAPNLTVYAATKAFVYSLAEGLRNEVKDKGVVVTALLPGATDTNFFNVAGMQNTKVANSNLADPVDVAKAGYAALMANDDHVVAPFKTKIAAAGTKMMPMETATKMATIK